MFETVGTESVQLHSTDARIRRELINGATKEKATIWIYYSRLCLHLCLFVCLSVCLLTGFLKTIDQLFMKFKGMVGHNPQTNMIRFGVTLTQVHGHYRSKGQNRFCE